jgi:hypothetical protein
MKIRCRYCQRWLFEILLHLSVWAEDLAVENLRRRHHQEILADEPERLPQHRQLPPRHR